jgi:hypothetical protein
LRAAASLSSLRSGEGSKLSTALSSSAARASSRASILVGLDSYIPGKW